MFTPINEPGVDKRSPFLFLFAVLLVTIPIWIFLPGNESILPKWMPTLRPGALAVWLPFTIATIFTLWESGWRGALNLLKRAFDFWKIGAIWYVPLLLLLPAVLYGAYLLSNAMGGNLPPPTPLWDSPIENLTFLVFVLFPFAIAEEIGWTAYATDPLQRRFGALTAALIVGVVWTSWHIIPYFQMGRSTWWVTFHCTNAVLRRIIMVWLYNNNRGSVATTEVFHAMFNISYLIFPVVGSMYDPFTTAIIVAPIVVIIVALWGPKTLANFRFSKKSA